MHDIATERQDRFSRQVTDRCDACVAFADEQSAVSHHMRYGKVRERVCLLRVGHVDQEIETATLEVGFQIFPWPDFEGHLQSHGFGNRLDEVNGESVWRPVVFHDSKRRVIEGTPRADLSARSGFGICRMGEPRPWLVQHHATQEQDVDQGSKHPTGQYAAEQCTR